MQSKMTESEARQKVAGEWGVSLVDNTLWAAIKVGLGLEFAPEPAVPVEALEYGTTAHGWEVWPARGHWASTEEKVVSLTAAALRYNAYPGLRAAAERLVFAIRDRLHPETQNYLAPQTLKLEDELAKGPK